VITLLKNIDDPIEIEKLRSDDDKYRLNLKRDGYATPALSWLRLDSFPVGSWFLSSGQMWVARPPPRCGHPKFSLSFFFFGNFFLFFYFFLKKLIRWPLVPSVKFSFNHVSVH
jgi:hypothetical protein